MQNVWVCICLYYKCPLWLLTQIACLAVAMTLRDVLQGPRRARPASAGSPTRPVRVGSAVTDCPVSNVRVVSWGKGAMRQHPALSLPLPHSLPPFLPLLCSLSPPPLPLLHLPQSLPPSPSPSLSLSLPLARLLSQCLSIYIYLSVSPVLSPEVNGIESKGKYEVVDFVRV